MKVFFSHLLNRIYWSIMSYKKDLDIESYNVSRFAHLEGKNIIRKGVKIGSDVVLGKRTYVSGPNSIIHSAKIGSYCSIALGVTIGLEEHDYSKVTTHPFIYEYSNERNPIKNSKIKVRPQIGNDVWIGCNAIILRGVKIGDGAVIAAGSLVNKDVESYTIVGGVPAKPIKKRFTEAEIKGLNRINWTSIEERKLINNISYFADIKRFINKFS